MPISTRLHVTAALSAGLLVGFTLVQSCSTGDPAQSANLSLASADPAAERRAAIEKQLRAIAADYGKYRRVSAELNWSPAMCRSPVVPSVQPTAAPDNSPHGRKLYFLYAKDTGSYADMSRHGLDKHFERVSNPPPFTNPVGQAVVKEAFAPVPAELERPKYDKLYQQFLADPKGLATKELERYAKDDQGKLVRTGELASLFVMLKLDPATPDTDNGWVYATIAPDLTTITSMGVIDSCMNCHKQTDRDRLYGDRDLWPERWPGAAAATPAPTATPATPAAPAR